MNKAVCPECKQIISVTKRELFRKHKRVSGVICNYSGGFVRAEYYVNEYMFLNQGVINGQML